jgi:hypothetical protein
MQLRKLATAMLVMGMTAGLAHAEDAAPAAGALWIRLPKTALSWSATVNLPSRSLTTTTAKSRGLLSGLLQRHR